MTTQLQQVNREISDRQGFRDYITLMAQQVAPMVPSLTVGEVETKALQLAHTVAALSAKTPKLRRCSPQSLAMAVAECAALDLMPIPGRFSPMYLIPRGSEVQAQISSRGLALLAQRSGWSLSASVVYEGEHFVWSEGLTPVLEHRPALDRQDPKPDLSNISAAYVVARKPGHEPVFRVLTRTGLLKRKKAAQTDKIWRAWPEEMALKCVIAYGLARNMIPLTESITLGVGMVDREFTPAMPEPQADPAAAALGFTAPELDTDDTGSEEEA